MESYRTSQAKFWWGDDDAVIDLTSSLDSTATVTGTTTVDRRRRITGPGRLGLTADGIDFGFQVQMSCEATAAVDDAIAMPEGILLIERADADWAIGIPAVLSATPVTSASGGIVSVQLTFRQRGTDLPLSGALHGTDNLFVPAGQAAIVRKATSITYHNSGGNIIDNILEAVVGLGIVAEES